MYDYKSNAVGGTRFTGQYSQRVGRVGFSGSRYRFFHENDFFPYIGDKGDRYRTAALYGSVKVGRHTWVSGGAYLLTGAPDGTRKFISGRETYDGEDAKIRSGILFGGISHRGHSYEFGRNSEAVRAGIQNTWHDWMEYIPGLSASPYFEVMPYDSRGHFRYRRGFQFSIY